VEKGEAAALSLRAAKAKESCTMTVEVAPECKIEMKTSSSLENENLESLKLKNKAAFESEIEAVSEVTKIKAKATGACGTPAAPEGTFSVKKGIVMKGVELTAPDFTQSATAKDLVNFGSVKVMTTVEKNVVLTINNNNTKFESVAVTNDFPALSVAFKLKAGSDTCSGNNFNAAETCKYTIEFSPTTVGQVYVAHDLVKYKVAANNRQARDNLVGEGKA
jgi:hypothetical protein